MNYIFNWTSTTTLFQGKHFMKSLVSTHVCKFRLQNYLLEILNQIQGRCLLSGEWLEKPTLPLGPELAWELLLYSTFLHSHHHRPHHHCHHQLLASPYHLQYQCCAYVTWLKSGGNFLTSRPSYFLLITTSNIGGQEFCIILWANISKANRTVPLSFWTWSTINQKSVAGQRLFKRIGSNQLCVESPLPVVAIIVQCTTCSECRLIRGATNG